MPLINRTVLMSDALHFATDQHINPYYGEGAADSTKAQVEHDHVAELFAQAGMTVKHVASPADSQDGVYTANWALVRGDTAILARLPGARKTEEAYAERVLIGLGKKVLHVPDGLKFSGQGDALACGDLLFCGSGYRSDEAAQAFAADALSYTRIQLHTVPELGPDGMPMINAASGWPDSFFYDIDLALSVIKPPLGDQKGLIAYCPEAFDEPSRRILAELNSVDKITVSLSEATKGFACNLVSTGETVIMSAQAPNLAASLRAHGLTILTPDITELVKGGGYIRCISLTLG